MRLPCRSGTDPG